MAGKYANKDFLNPSIQFESFEMYKSIGVGTPQRPSLADQQKIGFFSLDRGSQTDVTEVLDLKEMTEVIQILLQDVETLRKDINVTKHVMQADYEAKLQEKSLDLYCRINDKVAELEKMHEQRIGIIRKAYRQQLSDAICRVAVLYNKNLETKISSEKNKRDRESGKIDEKYRELQNQIQKNESVINMLRLQLQQYQQNAALMDDEMMEEESVVSESPEENLEADNLRDQLMDLEDKFRRLENQLETRNEETIKTSKELTTIKDQLQKEKNLVMQLQNDKLTMKQSIEHDKASTKRQADKQKKDMEKLMAEKLQKTKEEMSSVAQKQAKDLAETENVRIKELLEVNKLLEEQLEKERKSKTEQKKKEKEQEVVKSNDAILKSEAARLKKEIERIHKTWEKKFAILQQSLHALKDESYLRQTLQRQSANLHQAAVSYAIDSPSGIVPAKIPTSNGKKPLPDIPKHSNLHSNSNSGDKSNHGDKDYLSYTVSAPSGRGTTILSIDENQVMSDDNDQDLLADIKHLPMPPLRNTGEEEVMEDERPSTVSHVVVVPSLEL